MTPPAETHTLLYIQQLNTAGTKLVGPSALHEGPLYAGRSTRAAPREVAPRGPLHGGVADLFNTDLRSILMVLGRVSKGRRSVLD